VCEQFLMEQNLCIADKENAMCRRAFARYENN
jgi:hypothetical protein